MDVATLNTVLNKEQLAAVTDETPGPCLIYAGAGSGKTRTLIYRVAYLLETGVSPSEIVCITFTNKAALEISERLHGLLGNLLAESIQISTFHSFCAKLLRKFGSYVDVPVGFTIYDEEDSLEVIRRAAAYCGVDKSTIPPTELLHKISKAKSQLISPTDYANKATKPIHDLIYKVYLVYTEELNTCRAIDFDDLLVKAWQLVAKNSHGAKLVQNTYRHLLVDEYQDINLAQAAFAEAFIAHTNNFCAIGDPRQSIYGFNGADYRIITNFEKLHPGSSVHILPSNYRSTGNIVGVAESLAACNTLKSNYTCNSTRGLGNSIHLIAYDNPNDEALGTARTIQRLHRQGRPYSDFGIMFRTNIMSRPIESALAINSVPYTVIGNTKYWSRKEIKDVVAYLRLLFNPYDDIAFKRIVNIPLRHVGKVTIQKLEDLRHGRSLWETAVSCCPANALYNKSAGWKGLRAFIVYIQKLHGYLQSKITIEELLEKICSKEFTDYYRKDIKHELNVENLKQVAKTFPGPAKDCLENFLEKIALSSPTTENDSTQRTESHSKGSKASCNGSVSVMSLHQCKGLEFPVVFLLGVEENVLPHIKALKNTADFTDSIEEERRLFYVGITRAMENLYISYTRNRVWAGNTIITNPSRFLFDIDNRYVTETPASRMLSL